MSGAQVKQTSALCTVHSGSHYHESSSQMMIKGCAERVAFQVLCRTGLSYEHLHSGHTCKSENKKSKTTFHTQAHRPITNATRLPHHKHRRMKHYTTTVFLLRRDVTYSSDQHILTTDSQNDIFDCSLKKQDCCNIGSITTLT